MSKKTRRLSQFLSVLLVFLTITCATLFFQIITRSEVNLFGYRFYYVLTESMYPTIKPHSLILIKEVDPNTLVEGDIISFRSSDPAIYGMINTHRIVEIRYEENKRTFITMGDNNPEPDLYTVSDADIKGKVLHHSPPLKILTGLLGFTATAKGFWVVVILPLMLIASGFLESFIREFKTSIREEHRQIEEVYHEKEKEEARKLLADLCGKKPEELTVEEILKLIEAFPSQKDDEVTREGDEK